MISIHALARRATRICRRCLLYRVISIHALARRATHSFFSCLIGCCDFNPRSRKESDQDIVNDGLYAKIFQSTLSQGERPIIVPVMGRLVKFQSTLSQGERLQFFQSNRYGTKFQSTLSQGERLRLF